MRLLYLYPEEWTGRRAREVHTLSTCVALAQLGLDVTLLTAGGLPQLQHHLLDIAGADSVSGLTFTALSRSLGPIRSAAIFEFHFNKWFTAQPRFDAAYIIHLKAGAMLQKVRLPYAYEAHEIFAETPQKSEPLALKLRDLERDVLTHAKWRIATSTPLADALCETYALPADFAIVPNAGLPPLHHITSLPQGPFIYAGSIADWKGLDLLIRGTREAEVPLKVIGGTTEEWQKLGTELDLTGIAWQPRVALSDLPHALEGARAGLIATQPGTPSGRYSCPMKIFDYARVGLPVLTTALPSLKSLDVGPWCTQVEAPTHEAWTNALYLFRYDATHAEAARAWAASHTWRQRADQLVHALGGRG